MTKISGNIAKFEVLLTVLLKYCSVSLIPIRYGTVVGSFLSLTDLT